MPLVIGSGPSVGDYPKEALTKLAASAFTICTNYTAFDFPCDVIINLDPDFPTDYYEKLKALNKPIIIRKWASNKKFKLDFIEVPNEVGRFYQFSGMVAAKIGDAIANKFDGRPSFVIGIDGGHGNYQNYEGVTNGNYTLVPDDNYAKMGLTNTINLSMKSEVTCWPKIGKLPTLKKVMVHDPIRKEITDWLRYHAGELL